MSTSMTTERIIRHVENSTTPGEWEWEAVLEQAFADGWENAADAARFLEKLHPGRTWSAAEYNGLMYHHFTGRWSSAVDIGYRLAGEAYEDAADDAAGDIQKLDRAVELHTKRTINDKAVLEYLHSIPGLHVFDCADGTVLTFDGIMNGVIKEEEPA